MNHWYLFILLLFFYLFYFLIFTKLGFFSFPLFLQFVGESVLSSLPRTFPVFDWSTDRNIRCFNTVSHDTFFHSFTSFKVSKLNLEWKIRSCLKILERRKQKKKRNSVESIFSVVICRCLLLFSFWPVHCANLDSVLAFENVTLNENIGILTSDEIKRVYSYKRNRSFQYCAPIPFEKFL